MIPPLEIKELSVKDYWEIVSKRLWLVITVVTVITAFVAFRSLTSPKIYKAETTIAIEQEEPKIAGRIEDVYQRERRSKEYFQTQLNILKSRSLAQRVAKQLQLSRNPEFEGSSDPAERLLPMIDVRAVSLSNIAVISVVGKNPLLITRIANVLIREFIHQAVERSVQTAKYGVSWLEEQLSDTLKEMQAAEEQLNAFVNENKIVTIPNIESDKETLIESLKAQKAQLEKEITKASERYKEKHPVMLELTAQLTKVGVQLDKQIEDFLSLQTRMIEYRNVKRRVETYNALYSDLLARAKELGVSQELVVSNIRVVDPAQEPGSPIKPQPKKDITIAFIISLSLGLFLCFFMESLDSTLRTSDDVEFYTKLPFLGYIPAVKEVIKEGGTPLVSHNEPASIFAEAFRNLRVSLMFSSPEDRPIKSIIVTSSVPEEGKTTVSFNLAAIFAQLDEPTLLIDADMRRGRLSEIFKVNTETGLSSFLIGTASLDEIIKPTFVPNLSFIGPGPHTPNPTELLSSGALRNLLRELGQRYKRIIIDATPLLSVSEAIILGKQADGLIFIIKAGSTPLKYITEAIKVLGGKVKIMGAVLNNVDISKDKSYYQYHYYYASEDKK